MLAALDVDPGTERRRTLLDNARKGHPVRELAERQRPRWLPSGLEVDATRDIGPDPDASDVDLLHLRQTQGRHDARCHARLRSSLASTAFGGWFGSPHLVSERRDPIGKGIRWLQRANGNARFLAARDDLWRPFPIRFVGQFDSWRWWESLAAGCCTVHVDLDLYRCRFPVQPVRDEHYLGLDFSEPDRLRRELEHVDLEEIGRGGRSWALEHFTPPVTAHRLLSHLGLD